MKKKLVSLLVLASMLLSLIPVTAIADTSGTCGDNLTWKIENGILAISGSGEMSFDSEGAPWLSSEEAFTELIIDEGVTSIADRAFYDCPIVNFTMPKSMKEIGDYAFSGSNISDVELPNNIELIGKYAFSRCYYLNSMLLPKKLKIISEGLFDECSSFHMLQLYNNITTIEKLAFNGCRLLNMLYYIGSEEDFDSITVDEEGNDCFVKSNTDFYPPETEDIEVLGKYSNDISVSLENDGDTALFTIKSLNGTLPPDLKLYRAVYNDNGSLIDFFMTQNVQMEENADSCILEADISGYRLLKLMIWDKDCIPVTALKYIGPDSY